MTPILPPPAPTSSADLRIEPWPSERPLFALNLLAAAGLWLIAFVTIIGIVYGVMIGVFLFVMHLAFVSHLRGSGIRVGPEQLPEIHAAVSRLSARFGMTKVPETYVIHGGGSLNALATRFVGRDIVVLFSDLLDACEGNESARDMIIAHELGHLHRGHLRWAFVIAPAMIVPFLGAALSRAREYTCDRYGVAGAGNREGALLGLTVLAAGGRLARRVDLRNFAAQQLQLDTGLMTIGEWLSTHPPLAKRLTQIDPALAPVRASRPLGALRGVGVLAAVLTPIMLSGVAAAILVPKFAAAAATSAEDYDPAYIAPPADVADRLVEQDFERMSAFLHAEASAGRELPRNTSELYDRWHEAHPNQDEPRDPYDGMRYGYEQKGEHFRLSSAGPDDDHSRALKYDSRRRATTRQ